MNFPVRIIALTFALLASLAAAAQTAHAQAYTYAIGAAPCSPGGSSSIYCLSVPMSLAGHAPATFWIDDQTYPNSHFIQFSGTPLGNKVVATINMDASHQPTYSTVTYAGHTSTQMTSLSITFYGTDVNGDAFQGAMTISFDWYYVSTCSGRGCGGTLGWHKRVTGGSSTTFSIARYYTLPDSPIAPTPTCGLTPPSVPCGGQDNK